jgi:serine/threonine protein kinase
MGIVMGMMFMHQKNIMHRDLKPGNILVDSQMRVKICDFGTSKAYQGDMTQSSGIGSPAYQAPEVLSDDTHYTLKVDVFSFGLTAYEILTGERAINGETFVRCARAIQRGIRPELPVEWAPVLREVVESSWAVDPDDRRTFDEIFDDFVLMAGCDFVMGSDVEAVKEYVKEARAVARKMELSG